MDTATLRSHFPVFERVAYLNAGTDGPVPRAAVEAAAAEMRLQADVGRWAPHFERRAALAADVRAGYARLVGCEPGELALTSSTSEAVTLVLDGLRLRPGDEVLTSDEEHIALLGPLGALRRRGVDVRRAPLDALPGAIGPRTALVACSHVSWVSGRCVPNALAEVDVPVLLDGAQALGAVPVDVRALNCAAYAASGQKWLCGPDGLGLLYIAPALRERLDPLRAAYVNVSDPGAELDAVPHPDARRWDAAALPSEALAFARASLAVLEGAGWPAVWERGRTLAARLAAALADRGLDVAPRDASTLVAWRAGDASAERERLAALGVVVRDIPGRGVVRASVGAWNDEADLARLLAALPPA